MADYEYGRLHVDYETDFNGFMHVHMIFDVLAMVTNNGKRLDCTVQNANITYTPGASSSWGFANFAGIVWGDARFSADGLGFCPSRGSVENYDQVVSQMRSVSNGVIPDSVLWGVVLTDNAAHTVNKTIAHYTHSFALSAGDFDANGNLHKRIVSYASRWYNSGTPSVASGSTFTIDTNQLQRPNYYPWSVRKSGSWKSCNRSGGSYNMRSGGAWKGLKNSENTADTQHGVYRKNNGWQRLPKFGG